MATPPLFCVACIDFRFDAMTAEFFKAIGREYDFFLSTAAGGALALGHATCSLAYTSQNIMELFQQNLVTNLKVALTLQPIQELFLMNHQDCGAFKAFLPYSGYPNVMGADNHRELEIQGEVLALAHTFMKKTFPYQLIRLTLIDLNGSVSEYNINAKTWTLIHEGRYHRPGNPGDPDNPGEPDPDAPEAHFRDRALWAGMQVGDITYL